MPEPLDPEPKSEISGGFFLGDDMYLEMLTNEKMFLFFSIIKLLLDGTFCNNFLFFFLGILISKKIAPASLFTFPLGIKTPFRENITYDSVFFYGSGMYRKHPNHTYGRNLKISLSNQASMPQETKYDQEP